MAIKDFLLSLLPVFSRNVIVDDLDNVEDEISTSVTSAYRLATETFNDKYKFKSVEIRSNDVAFNRQVKGEGNIVQIISSALPDVILNLDHVRDLAKKVVDDKVASAGLTYRKANVIRVAQLFGFVSRYSMRYLNYAYILESQAHGIENVKLHDSLEKAEIEWIVVNFPAFCRAFAVVSGQPKQLRAALESVPDIEITDNSDEVLEATIGRDKIDPLMVGFIPVKLNPIYHIGMYIAEWQAAKYKEITQELELIRFRKLNLELEMQKNKDPQIQKSILFLEKRISELSYKQAKMERDYE